LPAIVDADAGDLAILHDVDTALIGSPRVAPGHGVVPHGAAAPLQQAALDREPRVVVVEVWRERANLLALEQFGVDAVHAHGIAAPRVGVTLGVGVIEVEHAALADHGVVVDVPLQPLPQLHRPFVERDVAGQQVVGAHDCGIAADVA
jgi:hypothetical protein